MTEASGLKETNGSGLLLRVVGWLISSESEIVVSDSILLVGGRWGGGGGTFFRGEEDDERARVWWSKRERKRKMRVLILGPEGSGARLDSFSPTTKRDEEQQVGFLFLFFVRSWAWALGLVGPCGSASSALLYTRAAGRSRFVRGEGMGTWRQSLSL